MRRKIILILLVCYLPCVTQAKYLSTVERKHKKGISNEYYVDGTLGYVLQPSDRFFKASISVNNVLFHHLGFYSSVESNPDDFFNICGITTTINSWAYLYGGVDLFAKNGLLNREDLDIRKEIGVGFTPGKWAVIRVGYSSSVGPSLTAGARLKLKHLFK